MKVVTASRRTDVPAFYTSWLLKRLEDGYCHTINPVTGLVQRVSLLPDDVIALGLYTRDPSPLLPHVPRLREAGYRIFTHVTVNGYGKPLEARSPAWRRATRSVRELAELVEPGTAIWRYDPVLLSGALDEAYHERRFADIAEQLQGAVGECYISFIDAYAKTKRNLSAHQNVLGGEPDWALGERHHALADRLAEIADSRGIAVRSCAEPELSPKVKRGACVDPALIARMRPALRRLRQASTRDGCRCGASTDVGVYGTCAYGCAYCYATVSPKVGLQRLREHDPEDTMLWRPPHLRGVDLETLAARAARRATSKAAAACQQTLFG